MNPSSQLRERAREIVEAYEAADSTRAHVQRFDQERDARLATLDAEIDELDRRADGCDESAVQQLLVKREQRTRLAAKLEADRAALVEAVRGDAAHAAAGCDLAGLVREVHAATLNELTDLLTAYSENPVRAKNIAMTSDAVTSLANLANLATHPQFNPQHLLTRIKRFADGGALWGPV